jgi:ABC-type transport system substrate-binding protein
MNKKLLNNLYFIIFVILFFTLITSSWVGAASTGETLNIRELKKPLTLNPIYAADDLSKKITKQIFENLVIINKQGKLEPYLAESWKIKDEGRTIEVNLRDDIYFHEKIKDNIDTKNRGRNVTAEDWKWSLNYLASPKNKSTYADLLENVLGYSDYILGKSKEIRGINVINKYRLEFKLKTSNALFLYNLAHPAAVVMPKEDVENKNLFWDLNPVGTGAFKFNNLDKNTLTLIKNSNYWDYEDDSKLPFLEEINFHFADSTSNNAGHIENYSLYKISSNEYNTFKDENTPKNYNLTKFPGSNIYYYGLYFNNVNYQDQQIDNKEFRESLNYIIDRKELIENLNPVFYMPIKANQDIFINKINNERKVEELRKIIESSSDSKLKLLINNKDINIKIAEEIKKQFLKYNIELEIVKLNWSNYINEIESDSKKYDLFFMSYNINNIFSFLRETFYSETEEQKDNYFNYDNSRLNYLLDYLEIETDAAKRDKAYEIIREIVRSDIPAFYLMQSADTFLVENKVKFLEKHNDYNNQLYKYIYLEK